MADLSSFDKPDGTSNHSNEVWETVRANIKAALSLTPSTRTNPGTGAVRRSTPSAGELLLETSNDATGSAWSTLFDSRAKLNKAGDTMTGALVLNAAANTRIEIQNSGDSNRGGYLSDTGSAFRVGSQSGVRAIEIAPDSTVSTTFAVGGNVGIKESPSANFHLEVANGGSAGIRAGAMSIGRSSSGYPVIGYNVRFTGTGGSYQYNTTTTASFVQFEGTSFDFYIAPGGSAGATMSPTQVAKIGENFHRLVGATPKIEHYTGGQVVGQLEFSTSTGRGAFYIGTRDTSGANFRTVMSVDVNGTAIWYSANDYVSPSGGYIRCGSAGVTIGYGSAEAVALLSGVFRPVSDNAISSGASGFRWSSVWAANGTIQTSDLTDKTDISPIGSALAAQFVQGLSPILFRWQVGGQKVEQVEDGFDKVEIEVEEKYLEEVQEPVTEEVEVDHIEERLEMVGTKAVRKLVPVKRKEQRPVGTWVPVVDENGVPVTKQTGTKERTVGRGLSKRTVIDPVIENVQHFVPTLRTVQVERTRTVKRIERKPRYKTITHQVPGKRLHAGFGAQDVKALMDKLGIDCGLWVLDENGKQHLRPDQLIPFLTAALANALERLDKLEGERSAA